MSVALSAREGIARITPRSQPGRVLLLGVDQESILQMAPQLQQRSVELVVSDDAGSALQFAARRSFELLLVRHPIMGLSVDEFLASLRSPDSESRRSFVLVLTEQASDEVLTGMTGRRLRFANSTDVDAVGAVVAEEVLGVAPRLDHRLMVEIGMPMPGGRLSRFCQVADLSESGMLVRVAERPDEGEVVDVIWRLPEVPRPIRARATVVRHTEEHEVKGVGLSFVDLDVSTRGYIRSFVEQGRSGQSAEA